MGDEIQPLHWLLCRSGALWGLANGCGSHSPVMAACWFSGLWVWMKLNTWIHTVLPVCAWDFRLSVLSWIVSNGQCQREVLLPQQQSSVAALWGVLATAGSRWYILVLVCTLRWESLKLRLYTVNSFPNSSIYFTLMSPACYSIPSKSEFLKPAGEKSVAYTEHYCT